MKEVINRIDCIERPLVADGCNSFIPDLEGASPCELLVAAIFCIQEHRLID